VRVGQAHTEINDLSSDPGLVSAMTGGLSAAAPSLGA
jgi:hypothetical protein